LAVQLAQGNNDANSTDTIGIVTETINDNQEGFVTTSGLVRNINTTGSLQGETWIDGDVLYLSPTIAGRITKVKPTAPNHSVILGYVVYAHANNGKIFVKVDNGYEIGELHDVYVPTPSNNDGIFWNSTNLRYENKTVAGALGYTPISGSGASGQVAYWNGTGSQTGSNNLFWDAANSRLGIGTNTPQVNLSVVSSGNNYGLFIGPNAGNTTGKRLKLGYFATANYAVIQSAEDGVNIRNLILQPDGGNLLVGTTTDGGQRLQVQGDAFIKGSGATSATTALTVQNSAGNLCFSVLNNTEVNIGSGAYFGSGNIIRVGASGSAAANLRFTTSLNYLGFYGDQISTALFLVSPSSANNTAGTNLTLWGFTHTFNPTSGTASYINVGIATTINQTGGANGITRGLYVNPILTAAADWRSIEWSNNSGWGLYGAGTAPNYLNGNLLLGSVSNTGERLQVTGTMNVTGASAFGADMTLTLNQNAVTGFTIINNNNGAAAASYFRARTTNNATYFDFVKVSNTATVYKIISPNDALLYNAGSAGDIAILNDWSSGKIKFAAGGSSTAHMTIKSNGRINMSSLPTSSAGLSAGDIWNDGGTLKIV